MDGPSTHPGTRPELSGTRLWLALQHADRERQPEDRPFTPASRPSAGLRVVHLSYHELDGGAAQAAHRLHQGLQQLGIRSTLFVRERLSSADPSVVAFQPSARQLERLARRWRRFWLARQLRAYQATRPAGLELFNPGASQYGAEFVAQLPPADVVNVHWISEFIDYGALAHPQLRRVPLVFTLHDLNAFTGGCHYSSGCDRFAAQCGACPQLGSREPADLSHQGWKRRMAALQNRSEDSVRVVADSYWLAAEARRSSILGRFAVSTIHYGLDTDVFAPRDRAATRTVLGLPIEAQVILFAAVKVSNPRKGFSCLYQALAGMPPEGKLLLSFGRGSVTPPPGWAYRHLGSIAHESVLAAIYSAADVFVIPSLEEAFGQTAMEAMACGVPVVGFRVGGIPDLVIEGQTGYLVPSRDVAGLRASLERSLEPGPKREELSANCRRMVEKKFSLRRQAEEYLALYRSLLQRVET